MAGLGFVEDLVLQQILDIPHRIVGLLELGQGLGSSEVKLSWRRGYDAQRGPFCDRCWICCGAWAVLDFDLDHDLVACLGCGEAECRMRWHR